MYIFFNPWGAHEDSFLENIKPPTEMRRSALKEWVKWRAEILFFFIFILPTWISYVWGLSSIVRSKCLKLIFISSAIYFHDKIALLILLLIFDPSFDVYVLWREKTGLSQEFILVLTLCFWISAYWQGNDFLSPKKHYFVFYP